jgi:phospholipase/carboxylesterase
MDNSKSAHNTASGKLLEFLEVTTGDNPEYSVIWLHGLGADGHDFEPIVPFLGLKPGTAVRFIFPHALMRPVTVNGGAVMRAWYDIIELSTSRGQDEAGIRHSAEKIRELVQGGAMALHVGLRYREKLAGIMALSSYLLFPERLNSELSDVNSTTPVFMGHGTQDPVVPYVLGQAAHAALLAGRWPVEWHSYPIPHSVSQPEIADIGRWLQARLG